GPLCLQEGASGPIGSEDCLDVNVYAPSAPPPGGAPVYVFFHGGGNQTGTANRRKFDGTMLALHGGVVGTANYPLDVFGFLAHPAQDPDDAGNFGLEDQAFALRWVHDNIAAFGGDPGRVTIGGSSSGGYDVALLLGAPPARPFFHRAIMESGYGSVVGGRQQAEDFGVALANRARLRRGGRRARPRRARPPRRARGRRAARRGERVARLGRGPGRGRRLLPGSALRDHRRGRLGPVPSRRDHRRDRTGGSRADLRRVRPGRARLLRRRTEPLLPDLRA